MKKLPLAERPPDYTVKRTAFFGMWTRYKLKSNYTGAVHTFRSRTEIWDYLVAHCPEAAVEWKTWGERRFD